MKISEAAEKCGLSIDTIRFYEKSGLLSAVPRGSDGHRRFTPEHLDWLILLSSLRATGMPMKAMRRFAELYQHGDKTVHERRQTLLDHADHLTQLKDDLDRCAALLTKKLALYDKILENKA